MSGTRPTLSLHGELFSTDLKSPCRNESLQTGFPSRDQTLTENTAIITTKKPKNIYAQSGFFKPAALI